MQPRPLRTGNHHTVPGHRVIKILDPVTRPASLFELRKLQVREFKLCHRRCPKSFTGCVQTRRGTWFRWFSSQNLNPFIGMREQFERQKPREPADKSAGGQRLYAHECIYDYDVREGVGLLGGIRGRVCCEPSPCLVTAHSWVLVLS